MEIGRSQTQHQGGLYIELNITNVCVKDKIHRKFLGLYFKPQCMHFNFVHDVLFGSSIEITDSCCHGQFHTQKTIIKDDYLSQSTDTISDFNLIYTYITNARCLSSTYGRNNISDCMLGRYFCYGKLFDNMGQSKQNKSHITNIIFCTESIHLS